MTIQDLNTYIKDKCPNFVAEELPLTYFSGKAIAIDAHFIMYKFMAVSLTETLPSMNVPFEPMDEDAIHYAFHVHLLEYLLRFKKLNIKTIMVFDGLEKHDKKPEHEKRAEQREKRKNEIENLKKEILTKDVLEQADGVTAGKISTLKKLLSQQISISQNIVHQVKQILQSLQIQFLTAKGDGERLCSLLAIERKVDAVVSTDSDCFAHGCPLIISEITQEKMKDERTQEWTLKIKVKRLLDILLQLECDFPRFVEFCIMSGCDYNERCFRLDEYKQKPKKDEKEEKNVHIDPKTGEKKKKTPIGITRAFDAIKEFKTINNLPPKYQTENLNYKRCRELFEYVPSDTIIEKETINIAISDARDILKTFRLDGYMDLFFQMK